MTGQWQVLSRTVLLTATVAGVLLIAGPSVRSVEGFVSGPQDFVDTYGADRACVLLVGLVLWFLAAWLGVVVVITLLGTAPGLVGRLARAVGRRVAPRVLRAVVTAAIGVGLTAGAAQAAPLPGAATVTTSVSVAAPMSVLSDVGVDWPAAPPAPQPAPVVSTAASGPTPVGSPEVVVLRGDCLWDIVAARLPATATDAQVAADVQRWYQANRTVIGADPDVLLPGQVLHPPA